MERRKDQQRGVAGRKTENKEGRIIKEQNEGWIT